MRSHLVERFWGPSELTIREWIGSINTSAFIVTYLENRCKLTLDECIALFPTVEIFQAAWFWPIGMIES